MPKAILELEMPESCATCPIRFLPVRYGVDYMVCGITGKGCPNPPYEKRRDDCPLKLVEGKEVEP